ncbi:MAG: BACON domain-containing protein [Bacteroidaceae bacterium]|nr:BACON domain-containing protein [Bacteroidaceae bacterium]
MKGLRKIIYHLFLILLLFSCDNVTTEYIEFSEESRAVVEQTIPYNSLSAKSVTFTSQGPWVAQVICDEPVDSLPSAAYNRSNAQKAVESWLSINPDRGDVAGEYTIDIQLEENNTNADRTAYVVILSGGVETKITVKQVCKANSNITEDEEEKESVVVVKYIDKLTIKSFDCYDDLYVYDIDHQYDDRNRIVGVTMEWNDGEEHKLRHCSFDYPTVGAVNMTIVNALPATNDDILDKAVAVIDNNGLVKSIDILDNYSGAGGSEATMNLGYDSNGYITSLQEIYYSDNFIYTTPFEYAGGCLTKIDNVPVPSYYFANRYENDKINVDINNFLLNGYNINVLSMFMYARMCGSMGDYIIEDAVSSELYSMSVEANIPVSNPNYLKHVEYYSYKKINDFVDTDYIFDEEGCPVKLNVKHKYQKYKYEYDLKAGNVIYSKNGVNYYEIVKTPEKETMTDVVKDTYIEYIFEYNNIK